MTSTKGAREKAKARAKEKVNPDTATTAACGNDGTGRTTKEGGSTRSCVPRQDVKRWSTSRRHKMYVRVPREVCSLETGKAPQQGGVGRRPTRGQLGKPNVRARWGRKGIQDTRQTRAVYVDTVVGGAENRAV